MKDINLVLLGRRLKDLRLCSGYSLQQLEEESGISFANLSRYENGSGSPKISTISQILKVYDITIEDLFAMQ